MNAAFFLLIAVGLSVIGSLVMWLWTSRPKGFNHSIDEFDKNLEALRPDGTEQQSDADYFGL